MNNNLVYGIVMCGGKSSRMGTDKSRIVYHEKEQQYHVYEMLQSFYEKVFISCKNEQQRTIEDDYNHIVDENEYENIGPMGGVLSSLKYLPKANLVVIGCDYPYLTKEAIDGFEKSIKDNGIASAFYNEEESLYEPLLAYYSAECLQPLLKIFSENNFSLQYFLKSINADKYISTNKVLLKSVDNKIEMNKVKQQLNK